MRRFAAWLGERIRRAQGGETAAVVTPRGRRVRRGSVPSALIGLVTFSFVLVVISAAAYTISLPALISATRSDISDSFFSALVNALVRDASGDESAESAQGAGDGASTAGTQDSATGQQDTSRAPVTIGGVSIDRLISDITTGASDAGGDSGTNDSPNQPSGDPGETDPGDPAPDPEPEPDPDPAPDIDPEVEQQIYEYLLARAQSIEGYVGEVNACVTSFNQNCMAPLDTRLACLRECEWLYQRLYGEFADMLNNQLTIPASKSRYKDAYVDLIAMYRCLFSYLSTIGSAWTANVAFENPAEHVDEFMAPIRADMVNGENKYYTEFKSYAEGFVL